MAPITLYQGDETMKASQRAEMLARHRNATLPSHWPGCAILKIHGKPWEIRKVADSPVPWDWNLTYSPEREVNSPNEPVDEWYATFEDALKGMLWRMREYGPVSA